MRNLKPVVLIATLCFALSGSYAYAGPGGSGAGPAGGMSGSHMGKQELGNTNGPNAIDRDKGLGRAADRRNTEAAEHNQVGHPKQHATIAHRKPLKNPKGAD